MRTVSSVRAARIRVDGKIEATADIVGGAYALIGCGQRIGNTNVSGMDTNKTLKGVYSGCEGAMVIVHKQSRMRCFTVPRVRRRGTHTRTTFMEDKCCLHDTHRYIGWSSDLDE